MNKILVIIKKIIPVKIFKKLQPAYHFLLSWFSAFLYHHPSEDLIVIGVTGTTGKTTSVYLIAKMLEGAGYKVGYTSTAMFNDGEKEWLNDKKMTMVGRLFIQKILRNMVKNGCQFAIVETTSEGVRQFRHRFINYDTVVFTGLYPEHIESHGSFENYKKAKGDLFAHLKKCKTKYIDDKKEVVEVTSGLKKLDLERVKKTIIANGDDEHAPYFLAYWADDKIKYVKGKKNKDNNDISVINYDDIKISSKGTSFTAMGTEINLKLLGEFNATNAMTSLCVGVAQDISVEKIKKGLEAIKGVPGRLEMINGGQDFTVIVDYAYEPEAVKKLYEALKLIPHQKIIHVLGSTGGGRDISRRPVLGKLAGEKADYVIVTNEDPYDDNPEIIINDVAVGAERAGKKTKKDLFKILDRQEGIKKALSLAKINDLVLVTGKGSEQAICIANGEKVKWDDREVVKDLLKELVVNN